MKDTRAMQLDQRQQLTIGVQSKTLIWFQFLDRPSTGSVVGTKFCGQYLKWLQSCADQDSSVHGPLLEEINILLKGFADHSVRPSANEAAHILAKVRPRK
jgi:hypothetical protein